MSITIRQYGSAPFRIALLHGGPGAPGEMAPVARTISQDVSVIEPFQSASTFDGQVAELLTQLQQAGTSPYILIGWSWGAFLAYVFAAAHPEWVKNSSLLVVPLLRKSMSRW